MTEPEDQNPGRGLRLGGLLGLSAALMAAITASVALIGLGTTVVASCAGLSALLALAGWWLTARAPETPPVEDAVMTDEGGHDSPSHAWLDALTFEAMLVDQRRQILAANAPARASFPGAELGEPVSLALRNPDILTALDQTLSDGQTRKVDWTERGFRVSLSGFGSMALLVFENQETLLATERMRVDFIANASHELRTPLASLLGFIETLQGPARDDAAARTRFLAIMQEQALRMSRLVNDLLSLSRIEQRAHQPPSERVDLVAVIDETLDALRMRASDMGVAIAYDRPAAPAMILGDRDELLRLLDNLLENAIKYGRSGERVLLGLTRTGASVEISVRDFGPGIPEKHLPRLTERFYRVDAGKSRESGGTGLGLALVKHIVQRHRGRLVIANAEGGGALFRVMLPALPV